MAKNRIIAFGIAAAAFIIAGYCIVFWPYKTSVTNDIYLIPEGFEGDIQVNYNVAGAPGLAKEGKYDVIPIRADGTYDTSKPDMEYGIVTDQYFYISRDGQRTPIDRSCVHVGGNGESSTGLTSIKHNYLKITRTKCGDDFRAWGN
ncbi:DUF6843 domain-containing protein [Paenibacillus hamazuiensis]|uniref:DUF6843 domain-containing protein n=1 Tax=Paenibacillus hamazuiensis TaxID=2936508 RepID=UPI00200E0F78|nr:hypothetical protein [Paenibacillus hamazuiensis]